MFSGVKKVWKSVTSLVFSHDPKQETTENEDGTSSDVQSQKWIPVEPVRPRRLADDVKAESKLMEPQSGPLPVYIIPLKRIEINVDGCNRFHFGKDSHKRNRTIMVLGATGAGKSTLINGMINYILGVDWEDPYRFKLVDEGQSKSQAESQTSEVTAYKLNHRVGFSIDYSLTIVDTPGFGDTRGITRDKKIVEQLRNLFSAKLGISEIDAVCFVAQAALARLTPTQKYVFDSVLSIFGKDVADNIRILVTFADGQRPPVLEAINASGVPCPKTKDGLPVHFKFNNSALFAHNKSAAESDEDDEGGFDKMFWNMGIKSMKKFFVALNVIQTKSLTMTKNVLREREQLEVSVDSLQIQVRIGLSKLEEIKETAQQLKDNEAEINRNKDFVISVKSTKPFHIDISGSGTFITNCQQCHFTCHDNCAYANDADKIHCCAMGPDGYCKMCPGKCIWSVHYNQKYRFEYREVIEQTTVKELEEKYQAATKARSPVQALIDRLSAEYNNVQEKVVRLMQKSSKCLNRLKEIALKPNPLSTPEYIDMLIEGEKSEAKSGWKQRVQYLMTMREKAEYMAKVERGEDLLQAPPTDLQSLLQEPNKEQEEETAQDGDQADKDQDQDDCDKDQDQDDCDKDQDQNDCDKDQDQNDCDKDQDQDESDKDQDQDESDKDQDQDESDKDQDQDEGDEDLYQDDCDRDHNQTNQVQAETDEGEDDSESDSKMSEN